VAQLRLFPCQELWRPARRRARSRDANTPVVWRCLRGPALRAGSGSGSGRGSPCFPRGGGGRSKQPSRRASSLNVDGSRYSSGLGHTLTLCLNTRALAAGAGEPVPQGKDFLVLWLLRRLPVRGVLAGPGQIKIICRVDLLRPLGRRLFHEVAEALGEALLAGVEGDLDFNLLFLPRRGVVAH
jgi:hypothetical protein